jgi:hypothetical protein
MSVHPRSAPAPDAPDRLALALRVGAHVATERGLSILHADDGAPVDFSVDPRKYLRKGSLALEYKMGFKEVTGGVMGVPDMRFSISKNGTGRDVQYVLALRHHNADIKTYYQGPYAFRSRETAARVVQLPAERLAAAVFAFQTSSLEMLKVAKIPLKDGDEAFALYGKVLYDIANFVATMQGTGISQRFPMLTTSSFTPLEKTPKQPQEPTFAAEEESNQ